MGEDPLDLKASYGGSRSSSVSYRPVVRYTSTYVSRPGAYVYTPGVVYVYHPVYYGGYNNYGYYNNQG